MDTHLAQRLKEGRLLQTIPLDSLHYIDFQDILSWDYELMVLFIHDFSMLQYTVT